MELKRVWGISIAALLYRARSLRVLSQDDYQSAMRYMSARGTDRRYMHGAGGRILGVSGTTFTQEQRAEMERIVSGEVRELASSPSFKWLD